MTQELTPGIWKRPDAAGFEGRYVVVSRLDAAADVEELYRGSHGTAEVEALWTYLGYGPFADKEAMAEWLASIQA